MNPSPLSGQKYSRKSVAREIKVGRRSIASAGLPSPKPNNSSPRSAPGARSSRCRAWLISSDFAAETDGLARIALESVQELLLKLALQMARDDFETQREKQR